MFLLKLVKALHLSDSLSSAWILLRWLSKIMLISHPKILKVIHHCFKKKCLIQMWCNYYFDTIFLKVILIWKTNLLVTWNEKQFTIYLWKLSFKEVDHLFTEQFCSTIDDLELTQFKNCIPQCHNSMCYVVLTTIYRIKIFLTSYRVELLVDKAEFYAMLFEMLSCVGVKINEEVL